MVACKALVDLVDVFESQRPTWAFVLQCIKATQVGDQYDLGYYFGMCPRWDSLEPGVYSVGAQESTMALKDLLSEGHL